MIGVVCVSELTAGWGVQVVVSVLVTCVCIAVVFVISLALFEFEEMVEDKYSIGVAFAVKGCLEGFLIPMMNGVYDVIATGLTNAEHQPTTLRHTKSLSIKKFTFEFCNAYVSTPRTSKGLLFMPMSIF